MQASRRASLRQVRNWLLTHPKRKGRVRLNLGCADSACFVLSNYSPASAALPPAALIETFTLASDQQHWNPPLPICVLAS